MQYHHPHKEKKTYKKVQMFQIGMAILLNSQYKPMCGVCVVRERQRETFSNREIQNSTEMHAQLSRMPKVLYYCRT